MFQMCSRMARRPIEDLIDVDTKQLEKLGVENLGFFTCQQNRWTYALFEVNIGAEGGKIENPRTDEGNDYNFPDAVNDVLLDYNYFLANATFIPRGGFLGSRPPQFQGILYRKTQTVMNDEIHHQAADLSALLRFRDLAISKPESYSGDIIDLEEKIVCLFWILGVPLPECEIGELLEVGLDRLITHLPESAAFIELGTKLAFLSVLKHDPKESQMDMVLKEILPSLRMVMSEEDISAWMERIKELSSEEITLEIHRLINNVMNPLTPVNQSNDSTIELPVTLQSKIVDFLISLPTMHDSESQQAFIYQGGLDQKLQDQILFGRPPVEFVPLLVSRLLRYGKLNDGRYALEVVLESSKNYIGQNRRTDCDRLLQELKESLAKIKE